MVEFDENLEPKEIEVEWKPFPLLEEQLKELFEGIDKRLEDIDSRLKKLESYIKRKEEQKKIMDHVRYLDAKYPNSDAGLKYILDLTKEALDKSRKREEEEKNGKE